MRDVDASHGEFAPDLAHGTIAPPARLCDLSGITRSGSTSRRNPRPVQVGHAPYGVLNEKLRGSSSAIDMSQWTQANCSE